MSNQNEPNREISLESLKSSDFDSSEIDKNDDESESISSQKMSTQQVFLFTNNYRRRQNVE